MLSLPPSVPIYLAVEPADMRNGIDGLVALVRRRFAADPFSGALFVFLGKSRDRVKVLVWDDGGFVLYLKRLEAGRFRLPTIRPGATRVTLSGTELSMLLSGIDLVRVVQPPRWAPRKVQENEARGSTGG
ncbi:MAG: IS66 family insertion sequence element accessory protein TnpB [Phycisphaerae bacterium]|nr:IS66 family insertion sequence element accessory protein TnpB [Phycisphaerae bacterium]MBM4398298.1 IS66 family insertion sequence element accessory protein TnpB [Deltaproteobacteria bacterium]